MNLRKNNTGITLVSLVITIIVMLILAGVSLNMIMGDTSVLKQASRATISKKLSEIKEEYEVQALGHEIQAKVNRTESKNASACVMGEDLKEFIPSIDKEYINKIAIFSGDLVFLDEGATEEEKQIAADLGYTTMNAEDYYYMFNMYKLEEALLAHKDDAVLPGTALSSSTQIEITGINYGATWYRIDASNLVALGFSAEDASTESGKFGSYAPFVARFISGEVLSDPGKEMYKDTPKVKHMHTFNYKGETDGIVVSDLLAGVDKSSEKSGTKFGAFSATNGIFNIDPTDGGLTFSDSSAIGELGLDQNVHINDEYTINVTVKCDVHQSGQPSGSPVAYYPDSLPYHQRAVIAISDLSGEYVCWMGFEQGYLRVYSFRTNLSGHRWSAEPQGFITVPVHEYDEQYMNIQFTAVRNGEAKLYINGELKGAGLAGKRNYSYKTLTIGDLRKDRGLKFVGNMYNVSIYGRALTEAEVIKNYSAVTGSFISSGSPSKRDI